jgi:transcriptional regulator with XRE-family HTH domain
VLVDLTDETQAFGDLLRRHRALGGMSQEELAERARLSARAISDLERGVKRTPRRNTVRLLVEALGLSGAARAAFVSAAREPSARPSPEPVG